jgi:hypothetical protein
MFSYKDKFYLELNIPFVILISFSVVVSLLVSCADERPAKVEKTTVKLDTGKLTGRWVRPDGGYVIEILNIHDEGTMEAAYYNPNPINIARAEWRVEKDRLKLFILFNDLNYPGSTYTLDYFPDRDQLIGAYFQAVQQETYYVEFVRQPK